MQTGRGKALSAGLQAMFGKLAARPVPEHVARVVDQLEAAAAALRPASSEAVSPEATPFPAPPSTPAP